MKFSDEERKELSRRVVKKIGKRIKTMVDPHGLHANNPNSLSTEKMVDAQKLREGPALRISFLRGQDRIAQAIVVSIEEFLQQRLVVKVRRSIQAQPAR